MPENGIKQHQDMIPSQGLESREAEDMGLWGESNDQRRLRFGSRGTLWSIAEQQKPWSGERCLLCGEAREMKLCDERTESGLDRRALRPTPGGGPRECGVSECLVDQLGS